MRMKNDAIFIQVFHYKITYDAIKSYKMLSLMWKLFKSIWTFGGVSFTKHIYMSMKCQTDNRHNISIIFQITKKRQHHSLRFLVLILRLVSIIKLHIFFLYLQKVWNRIAWNVIGWKEPPDIRNYINFWNLNCDNHLSSVLTPQYFTWSNTLASVDIRFGCFDSVPFGYRFGWLVFCFFFFLWVWG